MTYPKHISGTWKFSGDWLGSYRLIDKQDLGDPIVELKDMTCPICEFPNAYHLSRQHHTFPLHYWCPACETIYQWYIARCPDCDGFIWKKDCKEGIVICSLCDMEFEQEFIQEFNESVDFHNKEEE